MKDGRAVAIAAVLLVIVVACGQPSAETGIAGQTGTSALPAQAPDEGAPASARAEPPQRQSPLLAPEEKRLPLVVLPGDAAVEVDGVPVRRRNGVVDLTGKVGAVFHVRVRRRDRSTDERVVTIKEAGVSPPVIDLNEPTTGGAATKAGEKPRAVAFEEN